MSVPVFSFQIKYDILPGLVTVGKYDGSHSCLTAATTGVKVSVGNFPLIHSSTLLTYPFVMEYYQFDRY